VPCASLFGVSSIVWHRLHSNGLICIASHKVWGLLLVNATFDIRPAKKKVPAYKTAP
jgi:hypothetical protein